MNPPDDLKTLLAECKPHLETPNYEECLLILEKKFGITLAPEDLNEEVLSSATALAKRIAALRQAQADPGRRSDARA